MAYWPPERFTGSYHSYDIRSDIWSLGISLLEIIDGYLPYKQKSGENLKECHVFMVINVITDTDYIKMVKDVIKGNYSEICEEFINFCLKTLQERAKIEDLNATEFYKIHDKKNNELTEKLMKLVIRYQVNQSYIKRQHFRN